MCVGSEHRNSAVFFVWTFALFMMPNKQNKRKEGEWG